MNTINWTEQEKKVRNIAEVIIKDETYSPSGCVYVTEYTGRNLKKAFDEMHEAYIYDVYFNCTDANPYLYEDEYGDLYLAADTIDRLTMLEDLWLTVAVVDEETGITFDDEDCTIDWDKGTFSVNGFTEQTKKEMTEFYE